MRRRNATTQFLKECIADALIQLMAVKEFEKITIQEITDRAKVGRATYFRHFSSKNDVITFKLVQLWSRWAHDHHLTEKTKYAIENANIFFEFNDSIRDLHKIIYDARLQNTIYDAFYQIMVPPPTADAIDLYKNRFLSYGLFGVLDEWIKRGYRESTQEMADIVTQKIVSG